MRLRFDTGSAIFAVFLFLTYYQQQTRGDSLLTGLLFLPLPATIMAPAIATSGVPPGEAGAAAALVNTMQQVGGALGTAVLSSIYAAATTSLPNLEALGQRLGFDDLSSA